MEISVKKILGTRQTQTGKSVTKFLGADDEVYDTFAAVEEGQKYAGYVKETQWGKNFNLANSQGSRGRSPEEQKSIVRQHSQDMALKYTELQIQLGKIKTFTISDILKLADIFDKDATNPGQATKDAPENKSEAIEAEIKLT